MMIYQGIGTRKTQRTLILQDQDMVLRYPIKDALLSGNYHSILRLSCQVQKVSTEGSICPKRYHSYHEAIKINFKDLIHRKNYYPISSLRVI